uniref:Uncharacterized protein n=1 Tax=Helianthus annuus TaxID=4232 RepID=A0A251U7A8_HELAN
MRVARVPKGGPRTTPFKFMRAARVPKGGAALGRHVAQHMSKLDSDPDHLRC